MPLIKSQEFINLEAFDISPNISKCQIKVMYIGENRNKTMISKEVAHNMSKTLRGCPIVGFFQEEKGDFGDHEISVEPVFNPDGSFDFKRVTKTVPYGFVAPDAKVWFQWFEDVDELGATNLHEYLMTEGYLWTGQFPESQLALDGRPQSMEIDSHGKWTNNDHSMYIIDDAIFSKLCILGNDVEPCFEGANVTQAFALNNETFLNKLSEMIDEFKLVFENKGGNSLDKDKIEEIVAEEADAGAKEEVAEVAETTEATESTDAAEDAADTFVKKKEDEGTGAAGKSDRAKDSAPVEKEAKESQDAVDEEEKKKKKYDLDSLKDELAELKAEFTKIKEQNYTLMQYKLENERVKKMNMIKNDFFMLSDDDTKEVVDNIDKYSLEDIEAKLAVVCKRKKVNFSLNTEQNTEPQVSEPASLTFNVNNSGESVSAILSALRETKRRKGED